MNGDFSHSSSSSSNNEFEVIHSPARVDTISTDTSNDDIISSSSAEQSSSPSEEAINQTIQNEDNPNAVDLSDLPAARDHSYLPGTRHLLYSVNPQHDRNNGMTVQQRPSDPDYYNHSKLQPCSVQLPILQLDGVVLFPNTTLPLRITNASFCQYLRREIDHARAVDSSVSNDANEDKRRDPIQVRIGIITRLQGTRRTDSLRSSRRLDAANYRDDDGDDGQQQAEAPVRRRMGRWNLAMIRRNVIPTRGHHEDGDRETFSSEESGAQQRSINYGRSLPTDRLYGRIGTLATITSINENDSTGEDASGNNFHHLIITAMTTGRFKIISPLDGNESMNDFEWRCYNIQELNDDPPQVPVSFKRSRPWKDHDATDDWSESVIIIDRKRRLLNEISSRTNLSLPSVRFIWPSNLVRDIVHEIKRDSQYGGIMRILPNAKDQHSGNFSFWLSSNFPLSNKEKLLILDGSCEAERLTLILRSIRKCTQHIRCNQCRSNIALVSNLFTLSSADGTSGAYVNEHGIVHQTTTFKSTIDSAVVCLGGAETRDSWFPGYSWTIAYCANCNNHLGWKFLRVRNDVQPTQFWGLI